MKRAGILLIALLMISCAQPVAAQPSAPQTAATSAESAAAYPTDVPVPTMIADEAFDPTEEVTVRVPDDTIAPEPEPASAEQRFFGKFSDEPMWGERSYKSKSIDVAVKTCTVRDTYAKIASYHVADIYVRDVTSIKTAAGGGFDTRYTRTVKEIADSVGALIAIDGDTYTHVKNSFVVRNGVLYRDTPIENTDICILYRDGRMETKPWGTFTVQEIMEIEHRLAGHNPRAAIGYYEPGHYCFVIVDGRDHAWSEGMRLSALSQLMEDLGCKVAYNLDGGDSALMYWRGEIISKSSNTTRVVSDIIYILPEE